MGTTADKLNKLLNTKQAIKQAIIDKGVDVSDDTVFADYPAKINSIESGSGGGDPYYENLWNWITSNNTDYSYLFHDTDYYSKDIDVSKLDTSNVKYMRDMFSGCSATPVLNVSNFNTGKVVLMNNMFGTCYKLESLDLSNFNTSNVADMGEMFSNCHSLTSLDLSSFDTSNVTYMGDMFKNCYDLTSLDLSSFDTSKVTDMGYMFSGCRSLTSLDLNNFNVSKVKDINYMFSNCWVLTELDVSNWDVGHITGYYNIQSAFDYCYELVDFYPPQNINANMTFSNSTKLSHDSLMRIINNLMTTTSTKTLTLRATNLAKLSDEEKAIATNKGWTLK